LHRGKEIIDLLNIFHLNRCMEGGAQEFLLKPLQLSDATKLRCHIKKLNNQSILQGGFAGEDEHA
jgi:hypothetical protein